ncbi:MAG: DUF4832 domain-containing protein [Candidatus Latescibacter sp.]|nr:DUF4832 domain-containing protein [Candidatus Latescibacter sp.]
MNTPYTLAYSYIRLDKYLPNCLNTDLDIINLKTDLNNGFTQVRNKGLKIIIRFAYNESSAGNDASETWICNHLDQIKKSNVLEENKDVIAVVQAGFIGAWGEWHSSKSNNNDIPPKAVRESVLNKLLEVVPSSRMVQVRRPWFKTDFTGITTPIDVNGVYNISNNAARIGHHNDCFLSTKTDKDTYQDVLPGQLVAQKKFLSDDGRFVVVGGETCCGYTIAECEDCCDIDNTDSRYKCTVAFKEMSDLHFSFLNVDWHPDVISLWNKTPTNNGSTCFKDISKYLGYRISLDNVGYNTEVKPGGLMQLKVELTNLGFASMYNERHVWFVLDGPCFKKTILSWDPRKWEPSSIKGKITLCTTIRIPYINMPDGDYKIYLWLPDPEPNLTPKKEYSVRFANLYLGNDIWDKQKGWNVLPGKVTIAKTAKYKGSNKVDTKATDLVEIINP